MAVNDIFPKHPKHPKHFLPDDTYVILKKMEEWADREGDFESLRKEREILDKMKENNPQMQFLIDRLDGFIDYCRRTGEAISARNKDWKEIRFNCFCHLISSSMDERAHYIKRFIYTNFKEKKLKEKLVVDKEYMASVALKTPKILEGEDKLALKWSQQLRCILNDGVVNEEFIYLPAMYLFKMGLLDNSVVFVDTFIGEEEPALISLQDVTIKKLAEFDDMDFQKGCREENLDRDMTKFLFHYFGELYNTQFVGYKMESPNPYEGTESPYQITGFMRAFFDDILALNRFIPLYYKHDDADTASDEGESPDNEKSTADRAEGLEFHKEILGNMGRRPDLAKFFYIYRSYKLWKYEQAGRVHQSKSAISGWKYTTRAEPYYISEINNDFSDLFLYADRTDDREYQRTERINQFRYKTFDNIIFDNEMDEGKGTKSKDVLSLGTLTGILSGNGSYGDELYTLLFVNGDVSLKNALSLSFIWRSRCLAEYNYVYKVLPQASLLKREILYLAEQIVRRIALYANFRNGKLDISTFSLCIAHLFWSHTNKKANLTKIIRTATNSQLIGITIPSSGTMKSLVDYISGNPEAYLVLFKDFLKKSMKVFPWHENLLEYLKEHASRNNALALEEKKSFVDFIKAEDVDNKSVETEFQNILKNTALLAPFICYFPSTAELSNDNLTQWIYYACIGLYLQTTVFPHMGNPLKLSLGEARREVHDSRKLSIQSLVKNSKLGASVPYYHLLFSSDTKRRSIYDVFEVNVFTDVANIQDHNSPILKLLSSSLSPRAEGLALLRSMAIFELILDFEPIYNMDVDRMKGRIPCIFDKGDLIRYAEEQQMEEDTASSDVKWLLQCPLHMDSIVT